MLSANLFSSNFIKSENIVIDISKNMMWQDNSDNLSYKTTWIMSKEYCATLSLNGYTDWRLPNIKELQTVVDIREKNIAINKEFKFTVPSSYWSNSADITNKTKSWYVGFETGATYRDSKDYDCYVRCIRSRFLK